MAPINGLTYDDYDKGKFKPDNLDFLNKSIDELFEESQNDALYLLDPFSEWISNKNKS